MKEAAAVVVRAAALELMAAAASAVKGMTAEMAKKVVKTER